MAFYCRSCAHMWDVMHCPECGQEYTIAEAIDRYITAMDAKIERLKAEPAKAQPVLDAAAAWYETQLHTPMAPKLRARTALVLAIKAYKATTP